MTAQVVILNENKEETTGFSGWTTNSSLYSIGDVNSGKTEWHFGGPGADPAPTVTTGGDSLVPIQSANLTGSVNPNNLETHSYFTYGETVPYGNSSPVESAGSGVEPVAVNTTIGSLKGGTTYHYRIVAYNSDGTSYGSERTFTTPSPPTLTTEEATDLAVTEAALNADINPNESETHYYFQYGESTAYGLSTPEGNAGSGATTVPVSAAITELQPSTTYHYRIVARTYWFGITEGNDETLSTRAPHGVSCTSSSFCQAVGSYSAGNSAWTLAEEWNGKEWVHLSTYYPPEGEHSELLSVSCTSTTFCMSVGKYITGTKTISLAEYWNGAEWLPFATYSPPEAERSEI